MSGHTTHVCLIGFGEVGRTLADDLLRTGAVSLSAWDVKFPDPDSDPAKAVAARAIRAGHDVADAVAGAGLVICAVTAAQDAAAAHAAAQGLRQGCFFFDLNSASPAQKRAAADAVQAAGGRYVEGAVMSPIGPKRIGSPILLGGRHASTFLPMAHALGFSGASAFATKIGTASAAKMCRSVMIKGIEALLTESLLSARSYGVEKTVLTSLTDLFPGCDWPKLAHYMIARSIEHGTRRAEEMREVAQTVREAGFAPLMSEASAARQDWAPQFAAALDTNGLDEMLDAILAARIPAEHES